MNENIAQLLKLKRPKKHRNIKSLYNGVLYDSKLQAAYAEKLDSDKDRRLIRDWKSEPLYELGGHPVIKFKPDFDVIRNDGTTTTIDIKSPDSRLLAAFRIKRKLFRALFRRDVHVIMGIYHGGKLIGFQTEEEWLKKGRKLRKLRKG